MSWLKLIMPRIGLGGSQCLLPKEFAFEAAESPSPQHALLAITYNCVAACPHCYLLQQDSSVFDKKKMMDEDLFMQILDSPSFSKVSKVTFAGVEALLHPSLFKWIHEVKSRGIDDIATITNGLLLQKHKVVEDLMDTSTLTHFNVSLDTDNKEEYCKVKGVKSCDFERILDSAKALADHFRGTPTRVSGSFVRYTFTGDDVRRILTFAQDLGFHKITLHALHVAASDASADGDELARFKDIEKAITAYTDYGVDVTVKVPVSVGERTFYCPSLAKFMCVGADGAMAPCCHVPWNAKYGSFDPTSENIINYESIAAMRAAFIRARGVSDESLLPECCRMCPKRTRGNLIFNSSTGSWSKS